jgi:hypothetical protein
VYARTVAGRTLSFGVSGMLYRGALVMFDRETSMLWSQVDGRAIKGPLAGQALQPVPSMHATWQEWMSLYPDSLVPKKQGERRSAYEDYNRDQTRVGIFNRRLKGSALPPKEQVLGMPIVLASPSPTLPVVAFERRVRDRVLSFAATGSPTELEDTETRSRWRISDGVAIAGPLKGERLVRAAAYSAFWFGWYGFFPNTDVWKQ